MTIRVITLFIQISPDNFKMRLSHNKSHKVQKVTKSQRSHVVSYEVKKVSYKTTKPISLELSTLMLVLSKAITLATKIDNIFCQDWGM